MSSPRYRPGFAQSERRRRRCGRGGDGGVADDGGGNGGSGRIIAASQGREREEGLEDRISRFWRTRVKIGVRCPSACRYMPSCTLWCWVLSDCRPATLLSTPTVSLNAPCGAGCFLTRANVRALDESSGLNAPCGAGCFLTPDGTLADVAANVLMHLVVLGAF